MQVIVLVFIASKCAAHRLPCEVQGCVISLNRVPSSRRRNVDSFRSAERVRSTDLSGYFQESIKNMKSFQEHQDDVIERRRRVGCGLSNQMILDKKRGFSLYSTNSL